MGADTVLNTENQLNTNYDRGQVFLGCNTFEKAVYENGTGDEVVLLQGTLMGRVAADDTVIPLVSDAEDGSQYPLGVLANDVTVADGDSADVSICVSGDVDFDKVILDEDDEMTTVIEGKQIRDRIAGDTVGIKLIKSTQMTGFDNQ
jgi:head decoration protein D